MKRMIRWLGSVSVKRAPWLVAAALGLALAPAARASNPIWINPLVCGTPIASYYLGDSLGSPWYVNFEIGQASWNYAQVGYGPAANGTGYNWGVANWYEDGEGSNKRVRRDVGGLQFTSAGNWYLICQAKESAGDTYTSGSACGWLDSVTYPPASMAYFTVNALNDPASPGATAASAAQIDLAWSQDAQGHNVMVVRKLSADSWTEPTQGAAYSVGNAIGAGTVVYNGSGTAYANTGLSAGTTYDYKFYSENYSYYSAGATASATTPKLDQTIDFPAIGNQLTTNVVALSATATSGLDVDFAVGSGPGSIAGTTLTFTGEGSVSIVASQPGNATYNAAPAVTNVFDVTEPDLAIVLSQTDVNVRENGEGRFFVRLNKDPGANLAAAVSRTAGDASVVIQAGASWGFNSANWSTWQVVTLAQADDANAAAETATFQVAVPGLAAASVEAATLDDDADRNLALAAGGATASSTYPCRAALLIDGVHNVRTNYGYVVCTSVPPGTITVDLKVTSTVSRVRILTWDWVLLDHRYRIESSLDGSAWSTLVDASAEDHHGWEEWDTGDVSARYLRFHGVSSTQSKDAVAVAELEVYGTPALQELIEVSKTAVNVREAGEGRFFVRLTQDPGANTVVAVERTAGSASLGLQSRTNWVFNSANWNVWQPVTLAQAAD
ncbi:MAG: discoidin domain-containing protein, partial [Kiritimatiellia bacterium]